MNDKAQHGAPLPQLALVVGAARSGTTLTRVLLDAHPEIGCPSEAGLPALMGHMVHAWAATHAEEMQDLDGPDPGWPMKDVPWPGDTARAATKMTSETSQALPNPPLLPPGCAEWIVPTIQEVMRRSCSGHDKRLYCDKSLDSVGYLTLVRELFPEVRVVAVFRHVMDVIASGLDASPWGFQAYGYAQYVRAWPENTVAALANYWLEHVTGALAWEKANAAITLRVKYEDLVLTPEKTVQAMQRFLGVSEDVAVLGTAFRREAPRGPGDYKVEYTTAVHASSIGRGKRVPVALLPTPLLAAVNEQLAVLDYSPLDHAWNAAERSVDGGGQGRWAARLLDIMSGVGAAPSIEGVRSFAVVAEDHRSLRWVVDPASARCYQGDGEVAGVVTGTAEDLVLMLTGEENLGVLLRSGRVRHVVGDDRQQQRNLRWEFEQCVGVLRELTADRRRQSMSINSETK